MASQKDKAKQDYLKGMKYKDIAKKYGVSLNTVKSWKQRYKWDRKGVHTKEKECTRKAGAPKGSKNALGNRGGHGGPVGNDNAVTHGFFRTIFPDDPETQAIIDGISIKSPLDILWENIVIQYTAIARAQKLMFVRDQADKTIEKVGDQRGNIIGEKWEVQQAWDKHATFLQAQSRAITTLERLIAKYEALLLKDLDTQEQELRIELLKAELDKIKNPDAVDMEAYITALSQTAEDIWEEEEAEEAAGEDE